VVRTAENAFDLSTGVIRDAKKAIGHRNGAIRTPENAPDGPGIAISKVKLAIGTAKIRTSNPWNVSRHSTKAPRHSRNAIGCPDSDARHATNAIDSATIAIRHSSTRFAKTPTRFAGTRCISAIYPFH
jgi:hypothetical protein